jgi:predicted ATP-grasp superfamily ATP-dependent carboligase
MNASGQRAVVLSGDANALSAARTLSQAGVEVYGVGGEHSPVRYSRVVAGYAGLGNGEGWQQRWLAWLLEVRLNAVLIPCGDDGLELLARNRSALEAHGYVLPEMDDDLALALLDKERTYDLARRAGIATPRTVDPTALSQIEEAIEIIGLPCALKPRQTPSRMPVGYGGKAFVVSSAPELAAMYSALTDRGVPVIVTEIIQGSDEQLCQYWSYRRQNDEFVLELTKHKVRQHPPLFGTGCYQVIAWDEEVAEAGRHFASALGLVGFSSVEFKRRASDGQLVLIECNYRLVDGNEAGRVAGVDAARVVHASALGQQVDRQAKPCDGVRFWHPVRDARAMWAYRQRGELTLRGWTHSLLHRQVTPYFSWRDPWPSIMVGARAPARALDAAARAVTRARRGVA